MPSNCEKCGSPPRDNDRGEFLCDSFVALWTDQILTKGEFHQSDFCRSIAAKDAEIQRLKAQVTGQTLGMMNFCEIILAGRDGRIYEDCEEIVGLLQSEVTKTSPKEPE